MPPVAPEPILDVVRGLSTVSLDLNWPPLSSHLTLSAQCFKLCCCTCRVAAGTSAAAGCSSPSNAACPLPCPAAAGLVCHRGQPAEEHLRLVLCVRVRALPRHRHRNVPTREPWVHCKGRATAVALHRGRALDRAAATSARRLFSGPMSLLRSGTDQQGASTQPPTPPPSHHATRPAPPRPQCHGTKTLRQRPGYLRTRDFGIVDDSRDSYLCFYCGPSTKVRQCAVGGLVHGAAAAVTAACACRWRSAQVSTCCRVHCPQAATSFCILAATCPAAAGPAAASQFDTNPFAEDDEQRAMEIQASAAAGALCPSSQSGGACCAMRTQRQPPCLRKHVQVWQAET